MERKTKMHSYFDTDCLRAIHESHEIIKNILFSSPGQGVIHVHDWKFRLRSTCCAVPIFHNHKSSFFETCPLSLQLLHPYVSSPSNPSTPVLFLPFCPPLLLPPPPNTAHLCEFRYDQTAGLCPAWHSLHICVENPQSRSQRGRCRCLVRNLGRFRH